MVKLVVDLKTIKEGARKELARRELFFYCQIKAPDFYKENREYIHRLCKELQDFISSKNDVLVINLPP